jgi:hypothetical protein
MEKYRVIVILRQHAPELKAAGVIHRRIFGTVARWPPTSHFEMPPQKSSSTRCMELFPKSA